MRRFPEIAMLTPCIFSTLPQRSTQHFGISGSSESDFSCFVEAHNSKEGGGNERESRPTWLTQTPASPYHRDGEGFILVYSIASSACTFSRCCLRSQAFPSLLAPNSLVSLPFRRAQNSPGPFRLSLLLTSFLLFSRSNSLQSDTRHLRPSAGHETNAGRGSSTHHHRRKQV